MNREDCLPGQNEQRRWQEAWDPQLNFAPDRYRPTVTLFLTESRLFPPYPIDTRCIFREVYDIYICVAVAVNVTGERARYFAVTGGRGYSVPCLIACLLYRREYSTSEVLTVDALVGGYFVFPTLSFSPGFTFWL